MNKAEIPYQVRWARPEDWAPAMNMIWKTFLKFEGDVYSPEGIRNFRDFITDRNLRTSFLEGDYLMMVALDEGKIIGAASVRDGNHLSLLFVDEEYHHQGVGSVLMNSFCEYLKKETGEICMTLKSSPYAVDFYSTIGFLATGPEEHYAGIRVTPMKKIL